MIACSKFNFLTTEFLWRRCHSTKFLAVKLRAAKLFRNTIHNPHGRGWMGGFSDS